MNNFSCEDGWKNCQKDIKELSEEMSNFKRDNVLNSIVATIAILAIAAIVVVVTLMFISF